jgi:hypothetical protein
MLSIICSDFGWNIESNDIIFNELPHHNTNYFKVDIEIFYLWTLKYFIKCHISTLCYAIEIPFFRKHLINIFLNGRH